MYSKQSRNDSLYPYNVNILLSKKSKNNTKKILLFLILICVALLVYFIFSSKAHASNLNVKKGKLIVIQSGCIKCHTFVKGKRINGIISLAGWGNKHFSIKQTEKAIRSCKADIYCSQVLTDKQVKYVAYYLNSLK
jgi:hypothetical protein